MAPNVYLCDLNIDVRRQDDRKLEIIANGLPLWNGVQVAVDTTLVCPVRRDGRPQPRADRVPGAHLRTARTRKETAYPELLDARRCRLTVVGLEVGGRWSAEAARFLRLLAKARCRAVPEAMRLAARHAYMARWSAIIACAAQKSFAASLLRLPLAGCANVDGEPPALGEVLDDGRWTVGPAVSRLPP